ncbi:4Fe-4S binding protein [bacterium]|nr:4Fe-4S binding protein [bacterium]
MLKDILDKKQCFKLVCGCGNEDEKEVEKLVALYSKAGCNFFDLCAKPEIVDAAKRGLEYAGIKENRYLCVSVGIDGDPHTNKAFIDKNLCVGCELCKNICPHQAIESMDGFCAVNQKRCIGCKHCVDECGLKAISLKAIPQDLEEIIPPLIAKGIDCIELHAIGEDEEEVDKKWSYLNEVFDGIMCISIDRSKLGDEKLLARVKRMLSVRKPYTTIIQADGIAMSGSVNDYRSTLQSIAITEFFASKNLSAYIMSSGGTNAKSTELAKLCEVVPHALAVGSYARKIVKDYVAQDDFLTNQEIFDKALKIAKNLIEISLKNMK